MSIRRGRGYGVIKPKTGIKPIKGQRKPRPRKWPAHMDGEARDLAFAQELAIWERHLGAASCRMGGGPAQDQAHTPPAHMTGAE